MRIYTRGGDAGETSLCSGERVAKDSLRMRAIGAVDEAQAALGMARALARTGAGRDEGRCEEGREGESAALLALHQAQCKLSGLMADLAEAGGDVRVAAVDVAELEGAVDAFSEQLPKTLQFSVPGDDPASAALHVARTVVRRAEREVVALAREEEVDACALAYLNRLSDLCYVLAESREACGRKTCGRED